MKAVFPISLFLLALLGCNRSTVTTVTVPTVNIPTAFKANDNDDKAVFSAVLTHFAKQTVSGNASAEGVKKVIVVDSNSRGPSAFLSQAQLDGEFQNESKKMLNELSFELRIRNDKAVSVVNLVRGENLLVDDLSKLPKAMDYMDYLGAFSKKYPEAIRFVGLWLPAYSEDGTRAMVRFSFGPTAHGATATYLLMKENGNWIVKQHKLAYYA